MLYTQTVEKLHALGLAGMVEALEEQRRQKDITQLDFEARLALLVERQWLWRDNVKRSVMLSGARICRKDRVRTTETLHIIESRLGELTAAQASR